MRKINQSLLSSLIIASLAAASSGSVYAQQEELILEEVIVTAQKREQSLMEVPVAVSAISGEQMHDLLSSAENIRALNGRVPSLVVESSNGRQSPRFYIRGLGNYDFDVNANQPVLMTYDEIALENSVLKAIPVFDVARIEVLRGPQGTLFGRNTTAGIVKIDSIRPDAEESGYGMLSYGNRGTMAMEGAIGGGSETVSARLSLKYLTRDNWIDNTVNGAGKDFGDVDEKAWRLQVLFEPNDSFSGLFKLHGFDQKGSHPQIFYANAFEVGTVGLRKEFDEKIASQDAIAGFEMDHIGAAANLVFTFGSGMTLTSITGYDEVESFSRADIDGGLIGGPEVIGELGRQAFFNVASGDGLKDHNQFTQEFRLAHQVGNTFFQLGAFYFKEELEIESVNFDTSTGLASDSTVVDQDTRSRAVFGHVAYDFNDQWTMTGGLRYTKDNKDLEVIPGQGSFAPAATIEKDDDYVNWDLSLTYDVNNDWMVYGRAGNASRGPVTLGRFGFTSSADTETLTSFELGFKSTLYDGRMRWSADIYTFGIDDQQLTATGGVGNTNSILNADHTKGAGFETELEVLISDNFRLSGNMSYNDTEIDDPNLLAEQCGSTPGCTGLDPVVDEFMGFFGPVTLVSVDGNPLPRAPKWLFNVVFDFTKPISSGELYLINDWNYRSESNIFLYESVEFVAEKRWLGGLRAGWRNQSGHLDVALIGRNITDTVTSDGAIDFLNLTA
ncbi:MAG: TonB-dependent receptor, partial [Gammaproteobacteria bacterium]|nr:TonB-dependent receptor [Gammaproteobacteria bacterium]